jgi:hypothetical protein
MNIRNNKVLLLSIIPGFVLLLTIAALGQQSDEQQRFLEVRRRQLELQSARKQLARSEKLASQGLIPQTEVDNDRSKVETAQLNYQQAVLALLNLQPRISVRSAVKTQTADGRRFVRLVISNLTPTFDDSQFKLLNNFEGADPIPEELRTRVVNDIFVSLRDTGDATGQAGGRGTTTISLPYETHIPQLKYNEARTLDYQLLRDVDTIIVALTYRNQTQEIPVQLQRAAGASEIQIVSAQFSQEADLGNQATYNITLERPTVDVRSYQLKVVNLPRQISYSFLDLGTQARLSQINFPAGVTRQELGLRLFLPERADDQVRVDEPMQFWALALDDQMATRLGDNKMYDDSEIASAGTGHLRLVVIPRGVGRIEATAASLFSEIETGQNVEAKITIRNTGTRQLNNIKLSAEYPLNWRVEVAPDIIPALEINREDIVTLRVMPPADVGVGDYEVRIKTESFADNRRVQSEDKIYRISVKSKASVWTTAGLIGGLLAIVGGVVVFGIKMARR